MSCVDAGEERNVCRFRLSLHPATVGLLLAWFGAFFLYDHVNGALRWLWLPPFVVGCALAIVATARMFSAWREHRQVQRQ
jgi:hypothetical protein